MDPWQVVLSGRENWRAALGWRKAFSSGGGYPGHHDHYHISRPYASNGRALSLSGGVQDNLTMLQMNERVASYVAKVCD